MQCEVLALAFLLYAWMNSADSDNVIFLFQSFKLDFKLVIVKNYKPSDKNNYISVILDHFVL